MGTSESERGVFRQCVGIDISKLSFTACVCRKYTDDELCSGDVCEFGNDRAGFNQFVRWSRKNTDAGAPCIYLMEATGVYYEPLAYHLHEKAGASVCVIMPNKAKHFAAYKDIWTKTDETDSRMLAQLGACEPDLRLWSPPSPVFKELRSMCRFDTDLTKMQTQINNHLEALEHGSFPDATVLKHYKSMLKDIEKRKKANDEAIRDKVREDGALYERVCRLESIKGVGFSTIVSVLAETNGFEHITSRRQLASYAGLDVLEHTSGTSVNGRPRISKKGNARIRAALYFPAMVATRYNPQMREYYQRIIAKHPDRKKIGITAVQRKLLLLIYTLWKNGQTYNEAQWS